MVSSDKPNELPSVTQAVCWRSDPTLSIPYVLLIHMEASEKNVILYRETGREREREKKKNSNLARHHIAFDLLLRARAGHISTWSKELLGSTFQGCAPAAARKMGCENHGRLAVNDEMGRQKARET